MIAFLGVWAEKPIGGDGGGDDGGGGVDEPEADEFGELLLNGMMIPRPLLSWNGNNLNVAEDGYWPGIEWIMPAHPGYVPGGHYVIRGKCPDAVSSAAVAQLNIKIKKPGLDFSEWPDIGILTFLEYTKPFSTRTFHIPDDWNETDPIYISTSTPYAAVPYTLLSIIKYMPDPSELAWPDKPLIDQQKTYSNAGTAQVYWDGLKLVVDPMADSLPSIYFSQEYSSPRVLAPGRLFHIEGTSEVTTDTSIIVSMDWVVGSTVAGYYSESTAIITSANASNWSGDIRVPDNWLGHKFGTDIRISFSVGGPPKKVTLTSMKFVEEEDELLNGDLLVDNVSQNPSWDGAMFSGYSPYGSGDPFNVFEFAASPPVAFIPGGVYFFRFLLSSLSVNYYTFEFGYISSGVPVWDGGGATIYGEGDTNQAAYITIPAAWNGTDTLIFRVAADSPIEGSASFSIYSIKAFV